MSSFVFGGPYPGEALIPRLYTVHVLLIPALLVGLFTVHIMLVALQKHTQYPGPGRTNKNVVGFPVMPVYAAKAGGFFFIVFGVTTLLAAIAQINPIWAYGPYNPSPVTAGSQPDWYMGWLEGAIRLLPGWLEFQVFGWTFSFNIAIGGLILPGIVTTVALAYPFLEAWVTGDKREHHLLDRPRNAPTRTALGAMSIAFYLLLWAGGGNDIIATHFKLSINDITNFLRVAVFVIPPMVFVVTKRICLGLQRRDRDLVLHGVETGRVVRLPHGEFFEVHAPLDEHARWELVQHDQPRPSGATNGWPAGRRERRSGPSELRFEDRVEAGHAGRAPGPRRTRQRSSRADTMPRQGRISGSSRPRGSARGSRSPPQHGRAAHRWDHRSGTPGSATCRATPPPPASTTRARPESARRPWRRRAPRASRSS